MQLVSPQPELPRLIVRSTDPLHWKVTSEALIEKFKLPLLKLPMMASDALEIVRISV